MTTYEKLQRLFNHLPEPSEILHSVDEVTYREAIQLYISTNNLDPVHAVVLTRDLLHYARRNYPESLDILDRRYDCQTMLDKIDRDLELIRSRLS